MKKLLAFLGVCCILIGARVGDGAIFGLRLPDSASLQVYKYDNKIEIVDYQSVGVLNTFDDWFAIRIDTTGGLAVARLVMQQMGTSREFVQQVAGITVYYAYSPLLKKTQTVQGCKVNLMIAVSFDKVSIGYPILAGSY